MKLSFAAIKQLYDFLMIQKVAIVLMVLMTSFAYSAEIHDAVTNGDLNKVKVLLNANPEQVNSTNDDGSTPLHLAAQAGSKDVVELLLSKGANINARDNYDETPLHYAVLWNHEDVAEVLRQHGGVLADNSTIAPSVDPETNSEPITFTNRQGEVIRNAIVTKIEPNYISYRLADAVGGGRVRMSDLPESLQVTYGYDPAKAEIADSVEAEQQSRYIAKVHADQEDQIIHDAYQTGYNAGKMSALYARMLNFRGYPSDDSIEKAAWIALSKSAWSGASASNQKLFISDWKDDFALGYSDNDLTTPNTINENLPGAPH